MGLDWLVPYPTNQRGPPLGGGKALLGKKQSLTPINKASPKALGIYSQKFLYLFLYFCSPFTIISLSLNGLGFVSRKTRTIRCYKK